MSLFVSTEQAVATTAKTSIMSYTAAANDLLSGWKVVGEGECIMELQIDGVVKHIGSLKPDAEGDWDNDQNNFKPIALVSGNVVTAHVTKINNTTQQYRAEIY